MSNLYYELNNRNFFKKNITSVNDRSLEVELKALIGYMLTTVILGIGARLSQLDILTWESDPRTIISGPSTFRTRAKKNSPDYCFVNLGQGHYHGQGSGPRPNSHGRTFAVTRPSSQRATKSIFGTCPSRISRI